MGMYSYQSMDQNGKTIRGAMEAANLPDLDMRLKRMELDLIDAKETQPHKLSLTRKNVTRKDLINFCFHMEQLTGAGVPILEGLEDLRDSVEQPRFREVIADLIENIEGGSQLSEAMMRHPRVFDKTFSSLIMAGEQSGQLATVFKNLSDNLKWQDELASQTKKVLAYPLFAGNIILVIIFGIMIYLVPQLTSFLSNVGIELPWHTKVLVFVSNIFVNYWYVILAVPAMITVAVTLLLRSSARARFKADEYKLRIWKVGPLLQKIILARFATYFGLMYASGITILDCIRLSEGIVGNKAVEQGLRQARQLISEGQTVTASFQTTGIFPSLIIKMLKVGEATGSLDGALRNVSYFYNREVKESIEQVHAAVGPAVTSVLGSLIIWIVVSVLLPMYDIFNKMKI